MASTSDIKKSKKVYQASILLATGGTAGHVFPAIALIRLLQKQSPQIKISVMTDKRVTFNMGQGVSDVPDIYHIHAAGIVGGKPRQMIIAGLKLLAGFVQAWFVLRKLRPDMVIGFGGYSSLPSMFAANLMKLPTMIHEQNARLGRTNRLLAPGMNYIATAFSLTDGVPESSEGQVQWTGNPVRPEIISYVASPYKTVSDKGKINILILGGSQGALALGDKIPPAFASLPEDIKKRLHITHQVRREQISKVKKFYKRHKIAADIEVFFTDVAKLMVKSQLIICRSGAATLAEITTIGRPAIFIPYPFAADDHQTINATRIVDEGGGWMIPQDNLNSDSLAKIIMDLLRDPYRLKVAADCACKLGNLHAADNMAQLVYDYFDSHQTAT